MIVEYTEKDKYYFFVLNVFVALFVVNENIARFFTKHFSFQFICSIDFILNSVHAFIKFYFIYG